MRRFFVNRTTGNLQSGRADTGTIGNPARGSAGAVSLPCGGNEIFQLGFLSNAGDQTNADMGTSISGVLVLKEKTATSSYDGPTLTKCATWTQTTIDTQIFYVGTLDLTRLELAKLLGQSLVTAKEKLLVQCVADVDGSLDGTTFKLPINAATGDTPAAFCYFDFHISAGVDTTVTGSDKQERVTIAANDSASTVASAFATHINARTTDIGWTASASGANLTVTKTTVMKVANADPLSTGFASQLLAIGGVAGSVADVASVDLNAEFSYVDSGARQFCTIFTLTLTNTLYRSGQTTVPSGLTVVSTLDVPIKVSATGYTGGSGNLDGIATADGAMLTGQVVWFIHATEGIRFFQLVTGTDATSSPAVIRPGDYDGTTNARVWKQV